MPPSQLNRVIQHLLADLRPHGGGMTDGELLARFVRSRDEDALASLVRRHAPMVWGVCRRLLDHHDAEDAFQATFLVLVRKAAVVPREAVANWLYGVARQTGVRVRATAAKRRRREAQVVNMPEPQMEEVVDADLQRVVDEELSRLPDHYRGVIVLCELEGMTRKAAARQLGIPEGSVASRLARARKMLAKRLTQRGVVLSGSVAAVLSAGSASASAPHDLVASTIKAASLLAAGQAAGVISVKVAVLTEGVVKAMFVTKIKSVLAVIGVVLALTTLTFGVAGMQGIGGGEEKSVGKVAPHDGKEQAPLPGQKPKAPARPEQPIPLRAVYFVAKEGGGLSADDLKKHPEVKCVQSFSDLKTVAGKDRALWIDVTALPLLQGDKEREWVIQKNQEGFSFAVVGCNEPLLAFRDRLNCFLISGPGEIDWTKYETATGFSVIRQEREMVGKETQITSHMRGYKVSPTVSNVLDVTDRLLEGKPLPEKTP